MLYVLWITVTVSKFQISSLSVSWFPRSWQSSSCPSSVISALSYPVIFLLQFSSQTQPLSPHCCLYQMKSGSVGSGMSCCQLSLCLHGHRCAHNTGSSSKGRMNLLIIFVGRGDWCKKGGIWVTSSIERGHKKTCRLQNHQDPDQKRLGCIASVQVKTDGVLWAAVIIIADAEDCWDELIDLGVLAVGVCPSDMEHRRKADPSKMGCGYGGTNTGFSSLHAPVCCGKDKKSVALWVPWFWGAPWGAFMVGGSGHNLFSDLPSRPFTTTCDPLTLLFRVVLSCMICCSHGWALTWSWDYAQCHEEGLNKQHPSRCASVSMSGIFIDQTLSSL